MRKAYLLLIAIIWSSCDYSDSRLHVINKSHDHIAVAVVNDTSNMIFNNIAYYQSIETNPNDTSFIYKSGKIGAWDNYADQSPQKKLFIYVFNMDTLNKYLNIADMPYLVGSKRYLKRTDLTLDQLKQQNWEVIYHK